MKILLAVFLLFAVPANAENLLILALKAPIDNYQPSAGVRKNEQARAFFSSESLSPLISSRRLPGYNISKDYLGSTKIETFSSFPWDIKSIILVMRETFLTRNEWISFLDMKMIAKTGRMIQWTDGSDSSIGAFFCISEPEFDFTGDSKAKLISGLLFTAKF